MTLVQDTSLLEAIKQALSPENNPKRNFTQSVEMIVTFKGVDMKKGELKLREVVVLPKAPPKEMKVLVVPTLQQMESAKKAEPNVILSKEELQKLQGQKRQVKKLASQNDWFLIAPESMALAGRILGPALGPRNKFPTPLPNSPDIRDYVLRFKRSVAVKTKDQPHVQVFVGTENMQPEDLLDNAKAILNVIEGKLKSPSNLGAIYFKTTMGKVAKVKV